ncbi:elongator complex protein 6-like [Styela clava]
MFEELNQRLGWGSAAPLEKGLLLISSEDTDGGFLLHHFLSLFVKHKLPVLLVTLSQSFSHYAQACMKIGANLEKARTNGHVCCINIMEELVSNYLEFRQLDEEEEEEKNINLTKTSNINHIQEIFSIVNSRIEGLSDTMCTSLLVIDDICTLFGLGFSVCDIERFVHYLTIVSKTKRMLLVILMPCFRESKYCRLSKFLTYSAQIIIKVSALPSGHSKDVHGCLQILRKDTPDSIWQYKLHDKNLHIFAKGTSSAVL